MAGDWRSPVILIGTGDARHQIRYQRAAGADPALRAPASRPDRAGEIGLLVSQWNTARGLALPGDAIPGDAARHDRLGPRRG